jgi:hypothetical protein
VLATSSGIATIGYFALKAAIGVGLVRLAFGHRMAEDAVSAQVNREDRPRPPSRQPFESVARRRPLPHSSR